ELPPLAKFSGEFGILESREGGVLPVTLRNLEPEVAARLLDAANAAAPGTLPGSQAPIPARSLRLVDDDAEIARWLLRVEKAMEPRGERVRVGDGWEWRESTGSTSVFAGLPADAPGVRAFEVPKPAGARAFEVVGIPLEKPGFYVVEFASPRLGAALLGDGRTRYVATAALVTDLAVHLEWGRAAPLVWVTTLDGGEPVAAAHVQISDSCTGTRRWEGETGGDGIARVPSGALPDPRRSGWPGLRCGEFETEHPLFASARAA